MGALRETWWEPFYAFTTSHHKFGRREEAQGYVRKGGYDNGQGACGLKRKRSVACEGRPGTAASEQLSVPSPQSGYAVGLDNKSAALGRCVSCDNHCGYYCSGRP